MGAAADLTSIISAILFVASTVLNLYMTGRLSKLENAMNKSIDDKIQSVKREIEHDARVSRNDLRDELLRDIDQTNKRMDRIQNGH